VKYLLAIAALWMAVVPAVQAHMSLFSAPLAPEATGATGSGAVSLEYDHDARTLFIETTFSGLSGITTVAHIHCCVAVAGAGTAGVAVTPVTLPNFPGGSGPSFPPGVSAGSYSVVLDLSLASTYTGAFRTTFGGGTVEGAEAALIAGLTNGKAYFNVHTTNFPNGEIRGFLAPVPEASTYALMALGMLGIAATARRKKTGS
jgi:hypothetical protein